MTPTVHFPPSRETGLTKCCGKPQSAFPGHKGAGHQFRSDPALVTCNWLARQAALHAARRAQFDSHPKRATTCGRCGIKFEAAGNGRIPANCEPCTAELGRERSRARREAEKEARRAAR